ncbi:MAG: hypothetical protein SPL71_14010 [Oribacterium sp.]|nr:hypothetical protein [Oribacterium sp.]
MRMPVAGSATGILANYPTKKIIDKIFAFMNAHQFKSKSGAVYDFNHIRDACIAFDRGKVNGKIVMKV